MKSIILALFVFSQTAYADRAADIQKDLEEFKKNPDSYIEQLPAHKEDLKNRGKSLMPTVFTTDSIKGKDYVISKDTVRKKVCATINGTRLCLGDVEPGRAPYEANDLVDNLVDLPSQQIIRSLYTMRDKKLLSAQLAETPWSDNYWPIYQGILGARYGDADFKKSGKELDGTTFDDYLKYITTNPAKNSSSVDTLSPSEKYDLLLGLDSAKPESMTMRMWEIGKGYNDPKKGVETWMGICHGWAQAAYMLPRPKNAIEVEAAIGGKVRFYPADLKALGSLVWAHADTDSRFTGGRCNSKDPEKVSLSGASGTQAGRVKDQNCFDTNPGTWHLAVVNQIGVAKRSFVMDATFDYEVWNQPVYSYDYTYFNPKTLKPYKSLTSAQVEFSKFKDDKFANFRKPKVRTVDANGNWVTAEVAYIVGVSMNVTYVVETQPTQSKTDDEKMDAVKTVTYTYDLELDRNGNILGGEWYNNNHPDFLWTPDTKTRALSNEELKAANIKMFATTKWDGKSALPQAWQVVARDAVSNTDGYGSVSPQPLAVIVETLFQRSFLNR